MKITAVAIATTTLVVLLGVGGYGLLKHQPTPTSTIQRPKAQATVAPAPSAQLPEAFRPYSGRGTPGEAVAWHLKRNTPQANMDAYTVIAACQMSRDEESCDGITPEVEKRAGELLASAMLAGVQGAAVRYFWMLTKVPDLSDAPPGLKQAVTAMEESLKFAARESRDADAIASLYTYYSGDTQLARRDPQQALMYLTAMQTVRPPTYPAQANRALSKLMMELTPEQTKQALEAGHQLAIQCDCKG